MHEQKCFSYLGYKAGDFPIAEQAASEVVSVPIYPELSEEQLARRCDGQVVLCVMCYSVVSLRPDQ